MFLCKEILVWVLGHKIVLSLYSYFQALTLAFVFDTFKILLQALPPSSMSSTAL